MRRTVGLLGGSFNPTHAGHLHISREALKRLHLDEVWWLVSPRNPLKRADELADYAARLEGARRLAADERRIRVSDIEQRLGMQYTVDTLAALAQRYPRTTFVWLMGADNLAQFHRWKHWEKLLRNVRIAVLDRAPFSHRSLRSKTAIRALPARVTASQAGSFTQHKTPAWIYLPIRRCALSATDIREHQAKASR